MVPSPQSGHGTIRYQTNDVADMSLCGDDGRINGAITGLHGPAGSD